MGTSGAAATTQTGDCVLVQAALPGRETVTVGVLLLDPAEDRMYLRFRRDWVEVAEDEDDREVLEALADDVSGKAAEMGGNSLLRWMEGTLSNVIRVSERERVLVDSFESALNRLYRRNVASSVLPFRTHLPQYSLRAAAGKFGEFMEVEAEEWVEAPPGLRLDDRMFAAHVVGHSMAPRIPAGSLCVFRWGLAGSRQGKIVLVENYGETGENRYTIKRYRSYKDQSEGGWQHSRIVLEPLNPEFEAWNIEDPNQIRVIAEFLEVVETEL